MLSSHHIITLVDAVDEYCEIKIKRSLNRPLLISTQAEEVVIENLTIQNNVEETQDFDYPSDESSRIKMSHQTSYKIVALKCRIRLSHLIVATNYRTKMSH